MTRIVVGVDPGDSTGVAIFKDGEFVSAHQGPPGDMITLVEFIVKKVAGNDSCCVAVERFVQGGRVAHSHQPVAQQVVGAVVSLCEKYGIPTTMQGPADARAVASNDTLRAMGLWQTKNDVDRQDANDANSAVRHALLYMAGHYATDFIKLRQRAGT